MNKLPGNGVATASPNANNNNNAWIVNFNNGNDNNNKNNNKYARLVRPESEPAPFSLRQIDKAYRSCRKNKRKKVRTCMYEQSLLDNMLETQAALQSHSWRPKAPIAFVVQKPKAREIYAAAFEDRVVHHLLISQLEPLMEKEFIHDAASNRKCKGTHFAVERLQRFMRQLVLEKAKFPEQDDPGGYKKHGYYLQLDIANFFNSISHKILLEFMNKKLEKWLKRRLITKQKYSHFKWLCYQLITNSFKLSPVLLGDAESFSKVPAHKRANALAPGYGLPIGNLTSQFFANVYLNELDQFIKHKLKCGHYIRYVDDFILCHTDKAQLQQWHNSIALFLQEKLQLELSPKFTLDYINNGANFLGYIVRPYYKLVRKRVIGNLHEKMLQFDKLIAKGCNGNSGGKLFDMHPDLLAKLNATLNSYWGHFKHADSHRLKKHLLKKYSWLRFIYATEETAELEPIYCPKDVGYLFSQINYFQYHYPGMHLIVQVGTMIHIIKCGDMHVKKYPIRMLYSIREGLQFELQPYLFCCEMPKRYNGTKARQVRLIYVPTASSQKSYKTENNLDNLN